MELMVAREGGACDMLLTVSCVPLHASRLDVLERVLLDSRNWWPFFCLFGKGVRVEYCPAVRCVCFKDGQCSVSLGEVLERMDACVLENDGLEFYWSHF